MPSAANASALTMCWVICFAGICISGFPQDYTATSRFDSIILRQCPDGGDTGRISHASVECRNSPTGCADLPPDARPWLGLFAGLPAGSSAVELLRMVFVSAAPVQTGRPF